MSTSRNNVLDGKMKKLSLKDKSTNNIVLPVRPDLGTLGRKYRMFTNHFEISFKNDGITIYRYHIQIRHPVLKLERCKDCKDKKRCKDCKDKEREDNRKIFWKFVSENKQFLGLSGTDAHTKVLYDGGHSCYSLEKIASVTVKVPFPDDSSDESHRVKIVIKEINSFVIDPAKDFVSHVSRQKSSAFINILLKHYRSCPISGFAQLFCPFRNFLYFISGSTDQHKGFDLGGGVEAWKSLFSTARVVGDNRAVINMDVKQSAFYKCFTDESTAGQRKYSVIAFFCDFLNEAEHNGKNVYSPTQLTSETTLPQKLCRRFEREIKGLKIYVEDGRPESKASQRQHVVTGVGKSAIECSFKNRDGSTMSVVEYFKKTSRPLKYPKLFTLTTGKDKKPAYFPIEFCYLAENQKVQKPLTKNQTNLMLKQSQMGPAERKTAIDQTVRASKFHEDPYLKNFGFEIKPEMMCIDGRVLPHPKITYGSTETVTPENGYWKIAGLKLHTPASVKGVAVLAFGPMPSSASKFVSSLFDCCGQCGMNVPALKDVVFHEQNVSVANYIETGFATVFSQLKQKKLVCQLVIILLPQKQKSFYGDIKRCGDIVCGVMTQCITFKTLERSLPTMFTNIMYKINMKLSGINFCLESKEHAGNYLVGVPTLVLGIHVNHPGPTDKVNASLACVVGSTDLTQMRYVASRMKPQKVVNEQLVELSESVADRIMDFYKSTSRKPERIFVYRDGVLESQFKEIVRKEIRDIKEACQKIDKSYNPKITFVVARKENRTKFFPENSDDGVGKSKNVYPGTVIDTSIVHNNEHLFYLCSHVANQGTTRPTRYQIIHDDNRLSADSVQMVTFYLCHCVSRCTSTVTIPAPLFYADLVCRRARDHAEANQRSGLYDEGLSSDDENEWSVIGKHGDELNDVQAAICVTDNIRKEMYFT